jgi:hypothetical protein
MLVIRTVRPHPILDDIVFRQKRFRIHFVSVAVDNWTCPGTVDKKLSRKETYSLGIRIMAVGRRKYTKKYKETAVAISVLPQN